ncbi:MAG: squalene/phytoene synthase family protein [Verrucomicrobia bacterium]|nr:squalene/phytoene synthase family protein [Verrucomicrobiota bacterium]|tara:strand:+ start:8225 stop:9163 length:939 start_codon:yes stop_codon:yes gene_type:complete
MDTGLETGVLKGVSRSFYLSLRLLPKPMRRPAGIAYLLARISDTIADSAEVPAGERLCCLENFSKQVTDGEGIRPWSAAMIEGTPDPREKLLLERAGEVIKVFVSLSAEQKELIREVIGIIISGQRLDLKRFGEAGASNPISLANDAELEDYTWRVAGCVGEFWTKLGYLTLGRKFSLQPERELLKHAVDYGKSLQLVNILRDLPEDLANGRCYLPVADPTDEKLLMGEFLKWRKIALGRVEAGFSYSADLESRRLRTASILPAMIAKETLECMDVADLKSLRKRIKVPRHRVYSMVFSALTSPKGMEMKRT